MNVVHISCYSDKHSRDQATKPKPSRSVADVSVNRKRRLARLEQAVPAMRALFACSIEPRIDPGDVYACSDTYTLARVELAHLRGELGVLDEDRIIDIAALFGVDRRRVDLTWHTAADVAQESHDKRHRAASKRLADEGHAAVAHVPIVDLAEAARLFRKTKSRDDALFGKLPGRARIRTGMPTLEIEGVTYVVVRGVPDGPGTERLSTAQRKALARELGVETATVRRNERDRSPEEFDIWCEGHRKKMAAKAQRDAERLKSLGRRNRKPGVTAAVREYARRSGYSVQHSWRLLNGLTVGQIKARTAPADLVCIGGYGTIETTPAKGDESDKSAVHPAFQGEGKTRDGEGDHSHDESDNESDNEGLYPAFLHKSAPDDVGIGHEVAGVKTSADETSDFLAAIQAWKCFKAIPETADDPEREDRIERRHAMQEQTRAGTVYGNQPPRDDAEHDDDLRHLEDGREEAWAAFHGLDPAWRAA